MLLCAFAVMFAVPAWAAVTEVSTSADLIAAIKNPASNDIKLTKTISTDKTIEISKDLSIDLGEYNIETQNIRALHIKSGDVKITGSGSISATKSSSGTFEDSSSVIRVGDSNSNSNKAKLTIDKDVTVSTDHCYGVTVFGVNNTNSNKSDDIESILDGTVSVTGTAAAISGNGTSTLSPTTIVINGSVKSVNDYAIYHPGAGPMTISGTVEGLGGIEAKSGTIDIKDGAKITATATSHSHSRNSNGNSTTGYVIASVGNKDYKGNIKFNIANAFIAGTIIALSDDPKPVGSIDITGGAFSVSPDESYISKDHVVVTLSGDQSYKYGVLLSKDLKVNISTDASSLSKNYDETAITLTATPSATKVASIDIAYTYQWKKGALDNGSDVSGATSATLALTTVAESGDYYCEVKTGSLTIRPSAVTTVTINKAKPTVTAPTEATGLTYKGSSQALVTGGTVTGGTLQYVLGQDATTAPTDGYKADIPTGTNAGTYYVWYKAVATDTANYDNTEAKCVTVTIAKATPKVTAPTAKTLTYSSGSAQDLVNAGTTTGGTLQYSLDNSTYSETIPTGTNAGNYTVSYKVVGGTNYNDVAAATVEVTIAKATINPTVNIEGWTYGATASTPSVTANTGNGKVTYTYATKGASDYSETIPTNAGDYTVRAVIEATTNYESGTSTKDFTIAKADLKVTTPTGLKATYGQTLALLTC